MEKPTSPSSNQSTTATSFAAVENQNYVSPPLSPLQNHHQYNCHQHVTMSDLSSMYDFIFPPKSSLPHSLSLTPSSCSSSDDLRINLNLTSDDIATDHRLNQARLILEYQQLCDHFDLCFARILALKRDIETLRIENNDLRMANTKLIKLLSLSSQAAMNNPNLQREELPDLSMKRRERRNNNAQRNSLPKSVSVRSSSYLKVNQQQGSCNKQRLMNPSLRVYVPFETRREDKVVELEVYNQGMIKTELCNKWKETGTCPYAQRCQFAHGINQLRPVIRHPRYKTEVCRMVLVGQTCPYGHRCHFRHSLTDED